MSVFRCFTEKREGYDIEARSILRDLRDFLGISGLEFVRVLNRYDIEGISEDIYLSARVTVFAEPQTDNIYDEIAPGYSKGCRTLVVEALPGQYDQRADSCAQCIAILARSECPSVQTAKAYMFYGNISDVDMDKLRGYLINPVESREAADEKPETLAIAYPEPKPVETVDGFNEANESG
ncbi:MAG: phosphoribosylformylglycinamidine synthase, partial [Oscillospiraceae bacterium]|nr:phosphoribosylformylglycinamidine synthase [Oscillospiraceae bacterium]